MEQLAKSAILLLALCSGVATASAEVRCKDDARSLRPIMKTHTHPPYGGESRIAKQGTASLFVTVGSDGKAAAIRLTKSSGWEDLDANALTHVKAHWRWEPFPKGCVLTRVNVTWKEVE